MTKFVLTPIGRVLGNECIEVSELFELYGPVRPGLAEKTGFRRVHRLTEGVSLAEFAVSAVAEPAKAFLQANCDHLVVVSSSSRDVTPGAGSEIHDLLGLRTSCPVININDACTGFQTGLHVARSLLNDDAVCNVLLITVDGYSRFFPDSDLTVSPLFSDGAAAVLLSRSSPNPGIGNYPPATLAAKARVTETAGSLRGLLTISSENQVAGGLPPALRMRGGEVFSFVAGRLPGLLAKLKTQISEKEWDRVSWFVHQGSRLVVNQVGSALGQSEDSLFRAENYGNVVSNSIPFQLQDNWEDVRLADFIGLVSFGVGMAISVSVFEVRGDAEGAD